MRILIVEDEEPIREVMQAYLTQKGYEVVEAIDGPTAREKFEQIRFDLVVLDLNLPGMDGIEICRKIREYSQVPVIMVTARVEEIDEILGLEIGADDYLKKPFSPKILTARVEALLRRTSNGKIERGELIINPPQMSVEKQGQKINLTVTQFNILNLLAQSPGRVFTREEILNHAYDDALPRDVFDRTVDAHVKSIRKLIENDTKKPSFIVTVMGKGYKFNENN
jgi:DNA-binding response OmpR family regulator